MKLSIIVPVYNEGKYLCEVLKKIIDAKLPSNIKKEIIVINDGSTDNTLEIIKEFTSKNLIRAFNLSRNSGKGSAVRIGIKSATGDIILIQDGDLEYNPNEYINVIEPILNGESQVVYGSRFLGDIKKMRLINKIGSRILNFLTSLSYRTKITDQCTAYKAFKSELIKNLDLKSKGFEFCSEVTNKLLKNGIKIKEVPITYSARSFKEGKKCNGWMVFFAALYYMFHHRFTLGEEIL
ncbi:MAG: glycosyltransferase family 2 protein [Candidatus Melainabacteria bacterium]|nr:glycosyltransferase family 2 protein [Candidatus Melainabacteria bacterium]